MARKSQRHSGLPHRAEVYSFRIDYSEEDKTYVAQVLEFPSLAAYGATQEEALRDIRVALSMVVEDLQAFKDRASEPVMSYSSLVKKLGIDD